MRPTIPWVRALTLAPVLLVSACHKDAPAKVEPAPQESASAAAAEQAAAPAPAAQPVPAGRAAEFHEPQFDLTVSTSASYRVGAQGTFEVVVVPKTGFHTNERYPYRFRLAPAPGVKFPSDVVTREAVTLEPMRATMKIPVVPTASGSQEVGGQFSFSVCSADQCLVEKREVVATLKVF